MVCVCVCVCARAYMCVFEMSDNLGNFEIVVQGEC